MSRVYLTIRLMPNSPASTQTELRLSPGDGLRGLQFRPKW